METFEDVKEYFASKIPNYYSDPETKKVSPRWKGIWEAFCREVFRAFFNQKTLPENVDEETIEKVKTEMINRIDNRFHSRPSTIGEETEPAE